jgi:hypothetical protein
MMDHAKLLSQMNFSFLCIVVSLYCALLLAAIAALWFFLIIHLSGLQLCSTTLFSIAEETGNKTLLAKLILDDVAS